MKHRGRLEGSRVGSLVRDETVFQGTLGGTFGEFAVFLTCFSDTGETGRSAASKGERSLAPEDRGASGAKRASVPGVRWVNSVNVWRSRSSLGELGERLAFPEFAA